jgi:hypothetical protein
MISFCWYSLLSITQANCTQLKANLAETWVLTEPQLWYHFVMVRARAWHTTRANHYLLVWINLRIISTNRCSGNIDTITMYKWHKDLRGKPPQGEEGKTTGVDQPVHASFTSLVQSLSRTSRDYNTLLLVAHWQQQQQPQEVRYNKDRDITASVPFSNQRPALEPQIQTARNLVDK